MKAYKYITTDEEIRMLIPLLNGKGRIAVDFEGEFNLHIYGEHLCLVQIFDGDSFYIIDPRSDKVTAEGLGLLFQSEAEKIFFASQSDAALIHKCYGMTIRNIYDIRIPALLLGYTGNLLGLEELYLGISSSGGKKRKQTSNWLVRPLSEEQIEYALSDVEHLIELKDILEREIEAKGLQKECSSMMRKASIIKPPVQPWKKVGDWRRMAKEERVYLRYLFIARDSIAERFNVPAVRVMDKHMLLTLSSNPPESSGDLSRILAGAPPRFRKMLESYMWTAIARAREELAGGKRGQKALKDGDL